MAEQNPPWFIEQSNAYNAWDLGLPYRDLIGEGIIGSGSLAVSQRGAGANNSVDVAAGACWVLGDDNVNLQPCYRCYSNGVKNVTLTQDATFGRIALIVAHVYDAHFSGATYVWAIEAILGVASGSPVAPALPNNCLLLAQVLVPAVGTNVLNAAITDKRAPALVGGGTMPSGADGVLRKTTPKLVVNTVVETDLLNAEFTLAPNLLSTNRMLRLTLLGDGINNSGATQASPTWKIKLGATTIIQWGALAAVWAATTSRGPWRWVVEIANLGTASQWLNIEGSWGNSLANNLFNGVTPLGFFGTAALDLGFIEGGGASAVDTTVPQALAFTVALPVANALLDMQLRYAVAEVV